MEIQAAWSKGDTGGRNVAMIKRKFSYRNLFDHRYGFYLIIDKDFI